MNTNELTPDQELIEIATWFGYFPSEGEPLRPGVVVNAVAEFMGEMDSSDRRLRNLRSALNGETVREGT